MQVEVLRLLAELLGDERDSLFRNGGGQAFHRVLPAEKVIPRRVDPFSDLYRRLFLRICERLLADRVIRLDLFLSNNNTRSMYCNSTSR